MNRIRFASFCAAGLITYLATGCGSSSEKPEVKATAPPTAVDGVAGVRAKLDPAERKLVEEQEWCPISTDSQLGSMGAPLKLDIKGQAVFVCCKSCKKTAEADPDATLAKVAELKAKKLQEKK